MIHKKFIVCVHDIIQKYLNTPFFDISNQTQTKILSVTDLKIGNRLVN